MGHYTKQQYEILSEIASVLSTRTVKGPPPPLYVHVVVDSSMLNAPLHTYDIKHGQWTCDIRSFFENIQNNWPIWPDGSNKLWGIWGLNFQHTVFPRIVSALEQFPPLNNFRTFMYCHQRSQYIRLNSKYICVAQEIQKLCPLITIKV